MGDAACCSVLQRVGVCCSVLQCTVAEEHLILRFIVAEEHLFSGPLPTYFSSADRCPPTYRRACPPTYRRAMYISWRALHVQYRVAKTHRMFRLQVSFRKRATNYRALLWD